MSIFRNLEQPQTHYVHDLPGFSTLTEQEKKEITSEYRAVYESNLNKGILVAQGVAFATLKQAMNMSEAKEPDYFHTVNKHGVATTHLYHKNNRIWRKREDGSHVPVLSKRQFDSNNLATGMQVHPGATPKESK